jgi:hypothetical protein
VNYCDNGPCETEATKFYITDKGVIFYLCDTCAGAFELGQVNPNVNLDVVENLDIDDQIRNWIASIDGLDKDKPVVVAWGSGEDPEVKFVWIEIAKDVMGPEWPGSFDEDEEADAFAQRVEGALLDLGFQMLPDWPEEQNANS